MTPWCLPGCNVLSTIASVRKSATISTISTGPELSTGEVSDLSRLFLRYLETLHEIRAGAIREALARDGGYPLQIDATGEDGRGTLLVALAGWRRWVLDASGKSLRSEWK